MHFALEVWCLAGAGASSPWKHILAEVLRIPECCSLSSWADGVCLCLGNELCELPLLLLLMKGFFVLLIKSCSPPLLQSVCPLLPLSEFLSCPLFCSLLLTPPAVG